MPWTKVEDPCKKKKNQQLWRIMRPIVKVIENTKEFKAEFSSKDETWFYRWQLGVSRQDWSFIPVLRLPVGCVWLVYSHNASDTVRSPWSRVLTFPSMSINAPFPQQASWWAGPSITLPGLYLCGDPVYRSKAVAAPRRKLAGKLVLAISLQNAPVGSQPEKSPHSY